VEEIKHGSQPVSQSSTATVKPIIINEA